MKYSEHIRPAIADLIERGNITPEKIPPRMNSWEWEAIIPALDNEALVQRIRYTIANCERRRYPATTYEEALQVMAEVAAERLFPKPPPQKP